MKRFILILLVSIPLVLHSQVPKPRFLPGYDNKTLHFGFTVGINTMDSRFIRSGENDLIADISNVPVNGFQVTIVSDLRLNDHFNLRFLPGISFGQRDISFYAGDPPELDRTMELSSSYLEFPLLLKFRAQRLNNYRPYLIAGPNFRYDMAARKGLDTGNDVFIRFKPADLFLEMGFGIDFYLQFFKFAPELKLGIGLTNVLVNEEEERVQYVNSLDKVYSYVVMLNFHFE